MAKAQDYRWRGTKKLTQGLDEWDFTDRVTVTVPFTGPFDACISSRPAKGATMPGFETFGLTVESAKARRLEGSAGELIVVLSAVLPDEEDVSTEALGEPVFVIDWRELDVDIHTVPQCGRLTAAAQAAGVTWDDWEKIGLNATYYQDSDADGAWNYTEYAALRARGVETKRIYVPVITRTTYHHAKPSDVGEMCGTRQNPPSGSFGYPDRYEWLGGSDRCTKTGTKFQRDTEWIGVEKWDPLLYPEP